MNIRRGTKNDADVAAQLIFSSGPNSLGMMFNISETLNPIDFLRHAFSQPYGQFGFTSHLVAESEGQPIGLASCWTHDVSPSFRNATLQSLIGYFGVDLTHRVIELSQNLAEIIPAPAQNELGVGHIAIATGNRRKGVATKLLDHLAGFANSLNKQKLVLDVEQKNQDAIRLYLKYGFKKKQLTEPGVKSRELGLTSHWHMELLL